MLELDQDAILGPCPACNRANVLLTTDYQDNAIGACEDCDVEFVVELIVRLSPVGA